MPATKRGIYHNLKESKYVISNREITFYFSSEFYLLKFMDRYKDNRKKLTNKLKCEMNYHPIHLNMNTLADITLYKTIEKRGFYSTIKGVEMDWLDLQKYALRQMTAKNTIDWLRIPKPKLTERFGM